MLQVVAAMHAYVSRPRTSWVREWPAMVVLAVSQIFWARGVEESVAAGNVQVGRRSSKGVAGGMLP
jgi:dynein heavy chain